jgi:cytochrome c biogenesis protein CcmG/thiol:disulfide interchange protein DsbE
MRRSKYWLTIVSAMLSLISAPPAAAHDPRAGDIAPDFNLTLYDGTKVQLSDLRGQVVVLNFWATWCAPCRAELPLLDAYYSILKPHGLRVFAVATEDSVPEPTLRKLFAKLTIEPVHRLIGAYHAPRLLPTNYVIDRAGVIRYADAGAFNLDKLNEVIVPLLREPPPPPAVMTASSR